MVRQYEAQNMADNLLKQYGLYDKGWRASFSKSTTKLGICNHTERRIILSLLHLNSADDSEVFDTIKHEIAHALVGPSHGHNEVWKAKAIEIGCKPIDCGYMNVDAARSITPSQQKGKKHIPPLTKKCPTCDASFIEISRAAFGNNTWLRGQCGHLVKSENIKGVSIDAWTSNITNKTLFPYQVEGIKFLLETAHGRALIADEPGLGKTVQGFGPLKFHPTLFCPALWVCKTTLTLQTMKEAIDWLGIEYTPQIIRSARDFILPNLKLYVISMDLLRRLPRTKIDKMIKEIGIKTIIADEIQHFKNPDSARTQELRNLVNQTDFFIALSGTPWKNRGSEYFPVLNMISPERFPSFKHFANNWVEYYYDKKEGKMRQGGINNIPKFRAYTKDFIIRRLRDEVLPDLPKINREIRFVDMEELYEKAYEKSEEEVAERIKDLMLEGKSMQSIASEIMRLKHITGLAKVSTSIDDLKEFLENTEDEEKITVFHHHIDVGDNLQNGDPVGTYEGLDKWLVENGYNKSLRLRGGEDPERRNRTVEAFRNEIKNRVLIASTLASGEGLNLQFCQNAYMLERQWNPGNEEQAELRFSRPVTIDDLPDYLKNKFRTQEGKELKIRVPYYIAAGTIDEWLTDMVEKKRIAFRKTMNDKDAHLTWDENEMIRELAELIVRKKYGKK